MDLQSFLDILKRRAWAIVIVAFVALLVVLVAGLVMPPVYQARATVRVLLDVGVSDLNVRWDQADRLLNTYSRILKSRPILNQVIDRLSLQSVGFTTGKLGRLVDVEVIPDTELLTIVVRNEEAVLARDIANTLAELLVEYAQQVYTGNTKSSRQIIEEQLLGLEEELKTARVQLATLQANGAPTTQIEALKSEIQFKEDAYDRLLNRYELTRLSEALRANSVTILEPATVPVNPTNRLGMTEVALALLAGLFGGVGLALVLENLDTRVHSPTQLEHWARIPVLDTLPRGTLSLADTKQKQNGRAPNRAIEEAYRLLGTNLQHLRQERELNTVLITSAVPQEGKSLIASNLAQSLAERGQTVFLIEADMRQPSLSKRFGTETGEGLSDLLSDYSAFDEYKLSQVLNVTNQPSLFFIGGGPPVENPTALLASPRMHELLKYLGSQGQTTVVDGPPVLGMADALVLAPEVDGVIVVAREGMTRREQLLAALKQLEASRANILGLLFLKKSDKNWIYS